ncbi:MAG TPA: hypothetical protein VK211_22520 [Kamptonema sp.]|nr:hypothetical protein [Kamptonema sp.]
MVNEANKNDRPPENEDLKDLNGIAKGMIVGIAWSYADALEKNKQAESQQETAQKSEEDMANTDRKISE